MPSAESNDTIKISQRTIAHIVSWSQIIRATVAQIAGKQQLTWAKPSYCTASRTICDRKGEESGLKHAMRILSGIHGIAQITFGATDVLRHPLVKDILLAYEQKEKRK